MSIYIDISGLVVFLGISMTGIQRVEYNLINYFIELPNTHFFLYSTVHKRFLLVPTQDVRQLMNAMAGGGRINEHTTSLRRSVARRATSSFKPETTDAIIIPQGNWYDTTYIKALEKLCRQARVFQFVHDAVQAFAPEVRAGPVDDVLIKYFRTILPISYRSVPVSQFVGRAIEKYFKSWGIPQKPKMLICRLGADLRAKHITKPAAVKHKDFILQVATLNINKNTELLMRVFRLAKERGVELPHLYIAGQQGDLPEAAINQLNTDPYLKTKITCLGSQNNEQLVWLYRNAILTVVASFIEGYTMIPIESLLQGTVTLASNTSSIDEGAGRFADYFSPYSSDELLKLLIKYQDTNNRKRRERDIRDNYKHPTWNEVIQQFATQLEI